MYIVLPNQKSLALYLLALLAGPGLVHGMPQAAVEIPSRLFATIGKSIVHLKANPKGSKLYANSAGTSSGGAIHAWSLKGAKEDWQVTEFAVDGFDVGEKYISTCLGAAVLTVRKVESGKQAGGIAGYNLDDRPTCLLSAPDDKWVFIGTEAGFVVRMRANTDWKAFNSGNQSVSALAGDKGCKTVAVGGRDGTIRLMKASKGSFDKTVLGEDGSSEISALHFAPKGSILVSGTKAGEVVVWKGKKELKRIEGTSEILSLAIDPKGKWLVAGDSGGKLRVWDLKQLELMAEMTLESGDPATALVFVERGATLAAADGKSVRLYDFSKL